MAKMTHILTSNGWRPLNESVEPLEEEVVTLTEEEELELYEQVVDSITDEEIEALLHEYALAKLDEVSKDYLRSKIKVAKADRTLANAQMDDAVRSSDVADDAYVKANTHENKRKYDNAFDDATERGMEAEERFEKRDKQISKMRSKLTGDARVPATNKKK